MQLANVRVSPESVKSDVKRFILHIGPPKTGSTSIQDMLSDNQHELATRGFLYPLAGRPSEGECYQVDCYGGIEICGPCPSHQFLSRSLRGKVRGMQAEECWEAMLAEVKRSAAHTVILSAEEFAALEKERIERVAKFLEGYEVKVVMYRREPLSIMLSYYTQIVKSGRFAGSFGQFIQSEAGLLSLFPRLVSIWAEVFGSDRLEIKPFDKLKGSLEHNFLESVGVDKELLAKIHTERKNKSPSPLAIRLICGANYLEQLLGKPSALKLFFRKLRGVMRTEFVNKVLRALAPEYSLWTEADRASISDLVSEQEKLDAGSLALLAASSSELCDSGTISLLGSEM